MFLANCHFQDEVRLINSEIGSLECDGAEFINPPEKNVSNSGEALIADSMSVKGPVHLRKCHVQGRVRMRNAQIGGHLECRGAEFKNPPEKNVSNSGVALDLSGASVKGDVSLRDGFYAGEANLTGCLIGAMLDCSGTKIGLQKPDLSGTHIGSRLDLRNATFKTKLSLHETVVGTLEDDKSSGRIRSTSFWTDWCIGALCRAKLISGWSGSICNPKIPLCRSPTYS